MLKMKFYKQAMKCFRFSEDKELYKRSEAFDNAEEASQELVLIDHLRKEIQNEKSSKQKKNNLKKWNLQESAAMELLNQCSKVFLEIGLKKQAAQCMFSAQNFDGARQLYEEIDMIKQAGESCYMDGKIGQAAQYFEKVNDYTRALDCYDNIRDYENCLQIIFKLKYLIPDHQYELYVKKYLPLALQDIVVQFYQINNCVYEYY